MLYFPREKKNVHRSAPQEALPRYWFRKGQKAQVIYFLKLSTLLLRLAQEQEQLLHGSSGRETS